MASSRTFLALGVKGISPNVRMLVPGKVPFDFELDLFRREPHLLEDGDGDPVFFAEDAEEEVFGPQVVVLVALGLFAGQDDDLASPVGKLLEHAAPAFVLGGRPQTPSMKPAALSKCNDTFALPKVSSAGRSGALTSEGE